MARASVIEGCANQLQVRSLKLPMLGQSRHGVADTSSDCLCTKAFDSFAEADSEVAIVKPCQVYNILVRKARFKVYLTFKVSCSH